MRFIKIKNTIYDYEEYKLKIKNLKDIVKEAIEGLINSYGFVKENELLFYNEKYDIELKLHFKNRKKFKFI
ncbi:MAG: hypothetical protein QXG86_02175 [Candidatus Woesearchaeota archaeon]